MALPGWAEGHEGPGLILKPMGTFQGVEDPSRHHSEWEGLVLASAKYTRVTWRLRVPNFILSTNVRLGRPLTHVTSSLLLWRREWSPGQVS